MDDKKSVDPELGRAPARAYESEAPSSEEAEKLAAAAEAETITFSKDSYGTFADSGIASGKETPVDFPIPDIKSSKFHVEMGRAVLKARQVFSSGDTGGARRMLEQLQDQLENYKTKNTGVFLLGEKNAEISNTVQASIDLVRDLTEAGTSPRDQLTASLEFLQRYVGDGDRQVPFVLSDFMKLVGISTAQKFSPEDVRDFERLANRALSNNSGDTLKFNRDFFAALLQTGFEIDKEQKQLPPEPLKYYYTAESFGNSYKWYLSQVSRSPHLYDPADTMVRDTGALLSNKEQESLKQFSGIIFELLKSIKTAPEGTKPDINVLRIQAFLKYFDNFANLHDKLPQLSLDISQVRDLMNIPPDATALGVGEGLRVRLDGFITLFETRSAGRKNSASSVQKITQPIRRALMGEVAWELTRDQ